MKRLHEAMPIVATALGRKFGVQVAIGGTQALTDGQVIQIPDLSHDKTLRAAAWGYLAHEAAHVRYTDFASWDRAAKSSALLEALVNRIEDIRIEAAIRRPYPGTSDTLEAANAWMLHKGLLVSPTVQDHPAKVLTRYVLHALRWEVLGQKAMAPVAAASERVLREVFVPEVVRKLRGILTEVRGLKDTAGAVALAKRIQTLLEKSPEGPPPQEQAAEEGADGSPATGEADPDQNGGGQDPSYDAHEASPPAQGQENDGAEGQQSPADPSPANADQGANQQDTDDEGRHCKSGPDPEQGTAAARAALNAGVDDMDMDPFQSLGELLGAGHGPGTPMMLPAAEDFAGDPQVGQALLTKVKAESRKLTARLHGLVQASRLDRDRTVRRGRKLDGKRLHRAAVGDDRIFSRKAERVAVDTAIHLLVDLSGSMNKPVGAQEAFDGLPETRLYHRALEASLALALAFDGIVGVSTAVTAFPGITGQADRLTRVVDHPCQSRVRAGAFVQSPRGNTPMAQAMWYAAADLALRRESRRVMMVLTDGDPDNLDAVQDLVRLCRDAQIEVIGVGIAIDISHLFPVSIRVDAISDLKSALFGTAERLLMQRP